MAVLWRAKSATLQTKIARLLALAPGAKRELLPGAVAEESSRTPKTACAPATTAASPKLGALLPPVKAELLA